MTREEKIKEIAALSEQQKVLQKRLVSISKSSETKRATFMNIIMQIRQLEMQKHIIASQPIPNYIKGGEVKSGLAFVNENREKHELPKIHTKEKQS